MLFKVDIPPNTHFIAFDGIFRSLSEFRERRKEGKGSYAVKTGVDQVLDCYDKSREGKCHASKANSCLNLVNSLTNEKAVKNASMHHNYATKITTLKSGKFGIKAHKEVMYPYGSNYKTEDYKV